MKNIKRIFALMLSLAIAVGAITALTACDDEGDENTCEHIDTDFDGLCDDCGETYTAECTHADTDYNGKCDNCGAPYSVRVTATFTLLDESGVGVAGVQIAIYKDGVKKAHMTTAESGKATCEMDAGHYSINAEGLPTYWTSTASFASVEVNESKKDFTFTAINNTPDGSAEKPYSAVDAESGEYASVTVAAGASATFVTKGESRFLVINNPGVKVGYGESEYLPEAGVVRVLIVAAESTNSMITFTVTNTTASDTVVTLDFEFLPGSADNPYETALGEEYTENVSANATVYYTYTAAFSGKITVVCSNSGMVTLYNLNTYAQTGTGDGDCVLTVNAGDVIQIRVAHLSEDGGNVTFTVSEYVEAAE